MAQTSNEVGVGLDTRYFPRNRRPTYVTKRGRDNEDELLIQEPTDPEDIRGAAYCGDSLQLMEDFQGEVDLVVTSPPFALRRKKEYGNHDPTEYIDWFIQFAEKVWDILSETGDFVIDIGGGWEKGVPIRSTYHFELLVELTSADGQLFSKHDKQFNLAQDFYWYNPAKLPTPAQWVTIERSRVKDAVNHVWWLSKDKARDRDNSQPDNRDILKPYSEAQKDLIKNGYDDGVRPSGHKISDKFDQPEENGAIRPNFWETLEDSLYPWGLHDLLDLAGVSTDLRRAAEDSGSLEELAQLAFHNEVLEQLPQLQLDDYDPSSPVLKIANTRSRTRYLKGCDIHELEPHPARFPRELPEFFIKFLTDPGDLVMDIFGGSNITGWMAQKNNRNWVTFEKEMRYLESSKFWFMSMEEIKDQMEAR